MEHFSRIIKSLEATEVFIQGYAYIVKIYPKYTQQGDDEVTAPAVRDTHTNLICLFGDILLLF